jgi:hypothetical protein
MIINVITQSIRNSNFSYAQVFDIHIYYVVPLNTAIGSPQVMIVLSKPSQVGYPGPNFPRHYTQVLYASCFQAY